MRRDRVLRLWWIGVGALLVSCGSDTESFDRVKRGHFMASIMETGELQAVNARAITMPNYDFSYGRGKIVDMITEGTFVKKGDYVAQIDTSGVVKNLVEKEAELDIALADYEKLLSEQQAEVKQLEAQLESAEAALRMAVIDTLSVQFESSAKKNRSRLQYKQAAIELEKVKIQQKYSAEIQNEARAIQLATIEKNRRDIGNAIDAINRFTLQAPAEGMIEYFRRRWGDRRKVAIGDEFWPGEPLMTLPDLTQMKVATTVSETDIDKISLEQNAVVRLDAYPKVSFDGKIITISRMCRRKDRENKVKVFDVEILLDSADPILRPGMTVSADIVVNELEDALYVASDFVQESSEGYSIWIKQGGGKKEIPVELGPRNTGHVVVYGNVKMNDRLVLPEIEKDAV